MLVDRKVRKLVETVCHDHILVVRGLPNSRNNFPEKKKINKKNYIIYVFFKCSYTRHLLTILKIRVRTSNGCDSVRVEAQIFNLTNTRLGSKLESSPNASSKLDNLRLVLPLEGDSVIIGVVKT